MIFVNATVSPLARAGSVPGTGTPVPGTSNEKAARDCVKRHPVDQFSVRNLRRGYSE